MALQVWLPLIKDLRNQGLSNITVTNNGATFNSTGKLGGCYGFDGDDYITIVSNDLKTLFSSSSNSHSMACWIYLNSDETDRVIIFGNFSSNPFINWELTASEIQRVCAGGTSNYTTHNSTVAISRETWVHIAYTYNGSQTKFYINGILTNTVSGSNTLTTMTSNTFWLGSDNRSGATRLKGRLNDFRIYDHCLSPMEIKELSKGLVLHYKLDNNGWGGENLSTNTQTATKFVPSGTSSWCNPVGAFVSSNNGLSIVNNSTTNSIFTLSFDYTVTGVTTAATNVGPSLRYTSSSYTSPTWISGTALTIPTGTSSGHFQRSFKLVEGQITYGDRWLFSSLGSDTVNRGIEWTITNFKFEAGDKATSWSPAPSDGILGVGDGIEYDCSGYCNNGTRTGTFTWTSDTPKYQVSQYFNGSSYIKTLSGSSSWSNFEQLTIAAWMKPTATPSSWTGSIGIAHDGSYTNKLFSISNYGGKFTVHTVTGTAWTSTQSTYTCPLNQWHHYVATLNGTTVNMYVDGVLNKTYTISWGTATNHANPQFQVGVDLPGTDEIYTGYYSDVRIYATALSADDVKSLYQNSAYIDNNGNVYGAIHSEV